MPQPKMPPMCRSGRIDLGRQRLALLLAPSPCGTKGILILAPEPIVPRAPKRPFHVGFQLPAGHISNLRTWNELAESLGEPLLGPGASQGGRFACEVRPGRIDDRQPVATPDQPDPETRQLFMESLPRPKPIELCGIADTCTRPSRETLEAMMRLEVARPVAQSRALRAVDSSESKLFLEDARKRLIGVDGLVGVMDLERLGMNLAHRDMEMLVLLFAVSDRDVLVFLEPRRLARPGERRSQAPEASGVGPPGETR